MSRESAQELQAVLIDAERFRRAASDGNGPIARDRSGQAAGEIVGQVDHLTVLVFGGHPLRTTGDVLRADNDGPIGRGAPSLIGTIRTCPNDFRDVAYPTHGRA